VCDGLHLEGTHRGVLEDTRRWSGHARERGIKKPQTQKITATNGEGEDGARVIKVRVLLGALVVLVLARFAAGCGSASDQGQARQEVKEKVASKGQQARQEAEKKVNEKKQEFKKEVEAKKQEVRKEVEALQKQVDDLQKRVAHLQKKINAHEEQEQQQQINQLKKALNDLKKRVDAQERQDQKGDK
jgi:predicted RNase H-like nuclease (RuvC/YqgF family)